MTRMCRILLVEDNPDDVVLMRSTLLETEIPHELKVLQDGEEAIDYLLDLANAHAQTRPDLVILDLHMPKRNGHEVLAALRSCAAFTQLPVVVLSNSEDPEDKRKIEEQGASYVPKPANLENFFRVLEMVEIASYDLTASENVPQLEHSNAEHQTVEITKVLALEDNPADVVFLEKLFRNSPSGQFQLEIFESLGDALVYLDVHSVDVILSDLGLPDANGLEVLLRLQKAANNCPIVILTGLDVEIVAEQAVRQGAQDYLVKGQFDARTLLRSLKYAVTRKRAEEFALRAVAFENVVLQEILELSPVGIARFDSRMTLTTCNAVFADLFALDRRSAIGEHIVDLIAVDETIWQAVRSGRPVRSGQGVFTKTAGGDQAVLDLTFWPLKTRESEAQGGILLAVDISERIRLEKQHEEFIAMLAHDIKNPLIGADRVLTYLSNPVLSKEEHLDIISLLKQSNSNVLALLQNLLEITRYDSVGKLTNLAPLHIATAVSDAISLTAMAALAKNIKFNISVPESLPQIRAEHTAIERLFSNLFDNAIRFSANHSVVSLTAFEDSHDQSVVIEVADAGAGMTVDEQASIFRRFGEYRGRKYNGGISSGLGLYLCKQIVEACYGTISCSSSIGKGTKFTVRFPQASEQTIKKSVAAAN